ncbi:uncharacterized protein EAF02_004821 [Botrytis sinoallii]|uniref:uncharacterized protein n=1 Tax=Botrytis sinoallii TaxID=1463999 RepID=UPI00190032EB|nr:uncharacterized protein EAF02_004821 [Botrytis sinoallii]KAF7884485.1 hypothetical protein EAF02_004821 [Botrytis sinoallii]
MVLGNGSSNNGNGTTEKWDTRTFKTARNNFRREGNIFTRSSRGLLVGGHYLYSVGYISSSVYADKGNGGARRRDGRAEKKVVDR